MKCCCVNICFRLSLCSILGYKYHVLKLFYIICSYAEHILKVSYLYKVILFSCITKYTLQHIYWIKWMCLECVYIFDFTYCIMYFCYNISVNKTVLSALFENKFISLSAVHLFSLYNEHIIRIDIWWIALVFVLPSGCCCVSLAWISMTYSLCLIKPSIVGVFFFFWE
jgi:hypothetical protein